MVVNTGSGTFIAVGLSEGSPGVVLGVADGGVTIDPASARAVAAALLLFADAVEAELKRVATPTTAASQPPEAA